MIHTLAEHGGVMGLNFCPDFLDENNPPRETAAALAEQAAYVRKVGGIDVIGIGTDFDGIDGSLEIKDAGDMPLLFDALEKKGFTLDEIEKIAWKNVYRVYRDVLG